MKKILTSLIVCLLPVLIYAQQITKAEYFFDSPDPGQGNAISVSIGAAADSVNFNPSVSIAGLAGGLHVLHLRTMNSNGVWSLYEPRTFLIAGDTGKISRAEYFWDTDPGYGNGTSIVIIPPADSVYVSNTNTVPALSLGAHYFYYRVCDAAGIWSLYEERDVTVCSTYGARSDFDFTVDGNTVAFNNASEYDSTHYWMFGDGNTTNEVYTTHTYATAGIYSACLITSNTCATDTTCKDVLIRGIQSINPNKSGDSGIVIIYVNGFGFDATSRVRLFKAGQADIISDTTRFGNSKHLRADFIFNGAPHGAWDLIVSTAGFPDDTLHGCFTIEARQLFTATVHIVGPSVVLRNSFTHYMISVENTSNVTGFGIPVFVTITGAAQAILVTHIIDTVAQVVLDSVPNFNPPDSISTDTLKGYFAIPFIEPGSTKMIDFYMKSLQGNAYVNIETALGIPMFHDSDIVNLGLRSSCNKAPTCFQCALDLLGAVPWVSCASANINLLCSIGNAFDRFNTTPRWALDMDIFLNVVNTVLNCTSPFVSMAYPKGFAAVKMYDRLSAGSSAVAPINDGTCPNCILPPGHQVKNIWTRFFWDPNEKEGPTGINAYNFVSGKDPLNYNVLFTNADTATAPVPTVEITDPIDTTVFDLSTLGYDYFGFGDSIYYLNTIDNSFTQDIDLRPTKNIILRVTASVDAQTGIMKWRFLSLDTLTMNITENINDAFLPPNVNEPEGKGYIAYHIKPKPGLPHLQSLLNGADITFGDNAPMASPVWVNTIDTVRPASSVQSLSSSQSDSVFTVSWTGSDADAGLRDYRIFVSTNGGNFEPVLVTPVSSYQFTGHDGNTYSFYSIAYDNVGNEEIKTPHAEATTTINVGISEPTSLISLLQNKPNPFTGNTTVEFNLAKAQRARLEVTDLLGRVVYASEEKKYSAGKSSIEVSSSKLSEGVYNYRLITEQNISETKKMIVLK